MGFSDGEPFAGRSDTEAGRGEGDGRRDVDLPRRISLLSYVAHCAVRAGDPLDIDQQDVNDLRAAYRRLRQSDPGGEPPYEQTRRMRDCTCAMNPEVNSQDCPIHAAPTDEAPEGNDSTWTRQECGACGVEAGEPCDYACPVEGCDCPTHALPPVEDEALCAFCFNHEYGEEGWRDAVRVGCNGCKGANVYRRLRSTPQGEDGDGE